MKLAIKWSLSDLNTRPAPPGNVVVMEEQERIWAQPNEAEWMNLPP